MHCSLLGTFLFSLLSLLFGNDEAEIVFAGDAMMHQAQIDNARRSDGTYDYSGYFDAVRSYVQTADYAVVNLETPVSKPPYAGYPCFNAPESYLTELIDAGFDMFLTANNHTLDRNTRGLRGTIEALDRHGMDHVGTYVSPQARDTILPFIKNIGGIRVGFLNYTYGTNGIKPSPEVSVDYISREQIRRDVRLTRDAGAEIIVVCPHWGDEYRLLPNDAQKSLATFLKSLDVDVIIGGHPHVIQPAELTMRPDGRPQVLFYSLGNFISNMTKRDCRGGMVARVKLSRDDDGRAIVSDASYRLVFTEPPASGRNFRLAWADSATHYQAPEFLRTARDILSRHNVGVKESAE